MTHIDRRMTRADHHSSPAPQFWVVGGEFRDTDFAALDGPAEASGPFAHYQDAYREWERRSVEMKRHAHVRYTIVGSLPR